MALVDVVGVELADGQAGGMDVRDPLERESVPWGEARVPMWRRYSHPSTRSKTTPMRASTNAKPVATTQSTGVR
jgi:hypothetical protein